MRLNRHRLLFAVAAGLEACLNPASVPAAPQAHWTTNYYEVTGDSIHEIRRSIDRRRPRKVTRDALTEWNIRVRFAPAPFRGEYRCSGFTTTTTIRITLPRWTPNTHTPDPVVEEWNRYSQRLLEHETGHGRIAETAAREMQRRVAEIGTQSDPGSLHSKVQNVVESTMKEFRDRDREYDRLTGHGREQGAFLSHGHSRERSAPRAPGPAVSRN